MKMLPAANLPMPSTEANFDVRRAERVPDEPGRTSASPSQMVSPTVAEPLLPLSQKASSSDR